MLPSCGNPETSRNLATHVPFCWCRTRQSHLRSSVSIPNFDQILNTPLLLMQPCDSYLVASLVVPVRQLWLTIKRYLFISWVVMTRNFRSLQFDHPCKRCHTPTPPVLAWKHFVGDRYRGKRSYDHVHWMLRFAVLFHSSLQWSRNVKVLTLSIMTSATIEASIIKAIHCFMLCDHPIVNVASYDIICILSSWNIEV